MISIMMGTVASRICTAAATLILLEDFLGLLGTTTERFLATTTTRREVLTTAKKCSVVAPSLDIIQCAFVLQRKELPLRRGASGLNYKIEEKRGVSVTKREIGPVLERLTRRVEKE